jgi:hypothetical protein
VATDDRCSLRSLAAGEPLAGTASTIPTWLLIEHAGPWGADALQDARIPPDVGAALRRVERAETARVLLVRRVDRRSEGGVTCIGVDTADAWAGRTRMSRIEDVVVLDPADRAGFDPIDSPIAVVCTHGRRDPCCAERGRPLAQATAAAFPEATWESTHVGGDRFAGNLVLFPHGLYFGRVEPERGPEVVRAYRDGRIVLDLFRGRSRDPFPVQAAEHHLRVELGLDGIDDVSVEHVQRVNRTLRAGFSTSAGSRTVTLERLDTPPMRLTCHAEREESPLAWRFVSIEPTDG